MKRIINFLKKSWKYILINCIILFACTVKLPFYIDAPGGLINVSERIKLEGKYESKGTINLAYVTEYSVNLPMLIVSYFIDDWNLTKIETQEEQISYEESFVRDKLLMEESYANAIIVAFNYAGKDINILSSNLYVAYLLEEAKTNLKVGDQIIKVDGIIMDSKNTLNDYLMTLNVGDKITIDVINDNKEEERYAEIIDYNGLKIIGFVPVEIKQYESIPSISIPTESSEYGPSGGLMVALAVYDAITEIDITGGLTIVGTGTISLDGTVGEIGGVEYKIKGAAKQNADIFFVPVGDNYEEAKKIIEEENYDMKLVPVSTFEEALNYLLENVAI